MTDLIHKREERANRSDNRRESLAREGGREGGEEEKERGQGERTATVTLC